MTQIVDCKVEDAYNAVVETMKIPEWNPQVLTVIPTSSEAVEKGAQFVFKLKKIGNQTMEITDLQPGKSVTYSPVSSMFAGGHQWSFSENNGKTQIDHTAEMSLKGVFLLLFPLIPLLNMMNKQITRSDAASIQAHLEG